MEIMKKSLFFVAMAAVMLASCAVEPLGVEESNVVSGKEFSIVATLDDAVAKGTLDGSGAFTWAADDKIGMLVDGDVAALSIASYSGSDATFTATGSSWGTAAFYPWNASTTIEAGVLTFKLPSTYTWANGKVFTPMIADLNGETNPTSVKFKLAGAGIRVTLKGVPAYANLVALTVSGKNIKGLLPMDIADAGTEGIKATDGSNSTVYMKFNQAAASRDMVFTFPVPILESASSITVTLYTGTDTGTKMTIFTKNGSIPAVGRGQIVNTPELTVTGAPQFSRVFGKYATGGSTPWTDALGIAASSDRNVAVDDSYIYIAETNTSGNIWKLSKVDGSVAGKVKTSGVTTDANGTFYFACPRVLKMGSGTVLAVTNMQMDTYGHLHLYVWEDGVDNDPTDINLQWTGTNARIGEGWTFWQKPGDPSKTLLYFDSRTSDGVRVWKFANWSKGNIGSSGSDNWVHARRLLDGSDTNDASFWVYPDDKNKGIWTNRLASNDSHPYISTATNDIWGNGTPAADAVSRTELSGYWNGVKGLQFIELKGNRYISYIKRYWNDTVGGSVYLLMILGGGGSDSWDDIIANRANNLVYVASLAADQEGLDNVTVGHKMHPTHSAFDINAYTSSTESYIATDIQCSSLCLFKIQ